jgi:hypothetical protein
MLSAVIPPTQSELPDDTAPKLKVPLEIMKSWPLKVKLTEGVELQEAFADGGRSILGTRNSLVKGSNIAY